MMTGMEPGQRSVEMVDIEKIEKSKQLMEFLSQALDARNAHILESDPGEPGHYQKLKELDQAMWQAHSRWETFVRSSF